MQEDNIFTKERLEEIAEECLNMFLDLDDSELEDGVLVWSE